MLKSPVSCMHQKRNHHKYYDTFIARSLINCRAWDLRNPREIQSLNFLPKKRQIASHQNKQFCDVKNDPFGLLFLNNFCCLKFLEKNHKAFVLTISPREIIGRKSRVTVPSLIIIERRKSFDWQRGLVAMKNGSRCPKGDQRLGWTNLWWIRGDEISVRNGQVTVNIFMKILMVKSRSIEALP